MSAPRITRDDVERAALGLLILLQNDGLVPEGAKISFGLGVKNAGVTPSLYYVLPDGSREQMPCVDLYGAFGTRDVYQRIVSARRAISDYRYLIKNA